MRGIIYFLILFSALITFKVANAKKLPVFSASKNLDSLQVDSMISVCNDLLTLGTYPTDTTWKGNYNIYSAKGKVILGIKKNSTTCFPDTFSFSIKVRIKYYTQKTISHLFDTVLSVNYNKNSGFSYNEKAIYLIDSACYLETKILSISNLNYRKYLYIENQIEEERYYANFNTNLIPTFSINYLSLSDEVEINIADNLVYQTDEYDIEWTFISSYTNGGMSNTLSPSNSNYNFKSNSARVSIKNLKYKITNIFDKGYLLVRVRAVGFGGKNFDHRIVGNWTIEDIGNLSGKQSSYIEINTNSTVKIHQGTLGWQYVMDFAEEGRKKEVITYYDGSMRSRQTVTKNNTDKTAIVAETIYDFEGRPAINTLPVPAFQNIIKYYPAFNLNSNGVRYSYTDFEQMSICENLTDSMRMDSGSARYHSTNNPLTTSNAIVSISKPAIMDFVPVAFGYPFTQTVYYNDNTGRLRKQSGVGKDHKIGSGHETQYFYAVPFQNELDRLFGSEVGYYNHYKKNTVIDPNGQVSVSYMNASGKVIATALSGLTPTNVDSLNSNIGRNDVKANLITPTDTVVRENALTIKREFVSEDNDKEYKIYYSLIPEKYFPVCNNPQSICYDCVYDLEISLVNNLCGNQMLQGGGDTLKVLKRTISNGNIDTLCSSTSYKYLFKNDTRLILPSDTFITVNLNRGSYTLIKKLTVNEQAYEYYLNDFLNNRTCKTKSQFELEALDNLDTSGCEFTCTICFSKLGSQSNYIFNQASDKLKAGYTLTASDTTLFISQYNSNKAACDELCANENPSPCSIYSEVIRADVSPGGQYAKFKYDETLNTIVADEAGGINYLSAPTSPTYISYQNDVYFNGDSILVDGVKTAYHDLTVDQFVKNWKPQFADHLMQYHPEYCKYQWCIDNKSGFDFDKNFLSTETYQEAIDSGYLNPISTSTTASNDPFFKTTGSGTVLWNYMDYRLNTNFISNNTDISYSIRELPINILFCDDLGNNEAARKACVTQYKDSIENCKAYKDAYWKYFRSFYFSVKQQMMDSLRQHNGCNNSNIVAPYKVRFPEATKTAANDISASVTQQNQQLKDSCFTTCYAYKEVWREKLRKCSIDSVQMELILDSLVQVCSLGCDLNNPFGSSSVAPVYQSNPNVKLKSFNDVLTKALTPTNIYVPGICDVTLIQMPPKYGHNLFTTLSPFADTCSCNQVNTFKSGSSTCSDTLTTTNNNCPCTQATANKPGNMLLKYLGDNEEKYKCNSCISCDVFRNVYQAYYNIYDTFSLNTLTSQTLFTKFMNDSLNFNLSFKEYADFAAACMGVTNNNINSDSLFANYRSYYIVYKNNKLLLGYQNTPKSNFPFDILINSSPVLIAKESNQNNHYVLISKLNLNPNSLLDALNVKGAIEENNQNQEVFASNSNFASYEQLNHKENLFNVWSVSNTKKILNKLMAPTPPTPPSGTIANMDSCGCDKILLAVKEYEAKKTTDYSYLKNASQYFAGAYNNYHELSSFDTLAKICCRAVNGISSTINFAEPEPCVLPSDWAPNQWRKNTSDGSTRSSILSNALQNNPISESLPEFMQCDNSCKRQIDVCGCNNILSWYEKYKNDSTSANTTKSFAAYFKDSTNFDITNIDTLKQMCAKAFELSQEPTGWNGDQPIFSSYSANANWSGESASYLKAVMEALPPNSQNISIPGALSCYSCESTSTPYKAMLSCFDVVNRMKNKAASLQDSAIYLLHFADSSFSNYSNMPYYQSVYASVLAATGNNHDSAFKVAYKMQYDSTMKIYEAGRRYEDSVVMAVNDSFNKAPFFKKFSSIKEILEFMDLNGCLCQLNEDQLEALPTLIKSYLKNKTYSTSYRKNMSCNNSLGYGSDNPIVVKQCETCYIPDPLLLYIQNYLDTLTHNAETLNNGVVVNKLTKTWWRMYPKYKKYYQTPLYNSNVPSSLKYRVIALTDNKLNIRMFDSVSNTKDIELVFAEPFKRGNFLTIRKFFGIRLRNDLGCDTQTIKTFSIYAIVQRPGTINSTKYDTIYLTGKVTGWNLAKSINCCLKLCNRPATQTSPVVLFDPCRERIRIAAKINADYAWQRYTDSLRISFKSSYYAKCLRLNGSETFQMRYNERQYHYTLYYYDQSGNLVKTVPPAGIAPLNDVATDSVDYYRTHQSSILKIPAHNLVTHYRYNTLNQISWQKTPDAGESKFYYDFIGRLAVSQNAKQAQTNYYSYTLFDGLGRIKEVGEIYKTTAMNQGVSKDTANLNSWLSSTNKRQITNTYYDQVNNNVLDTILFKPENLRSRVAYSTYKEFNATTYDHAVHYSYDIHGNVKRLLREVPGLKTMGQDYKTVDYDYDLLSGKVNSVVYQKGSIDEYDHLYTYDADLRLTEVYSGPNNTVIDLDAKYYYYLHGPLARTELGSHQVQGVDYAYTIQGWLKGVNATTANSNRDMGKDGNKNLSGNENASFAQDVYGFTLSYFQGDYNSANYFADNSNFEAKLGGSTVSGSAPNLYNGNIRMMALSISKFGNTPMAYAYKYDQLNRLINMNAWNNYDSSTNAWRNTGSAMNDYHNRFTYDANGNILTQVRRGNSTKLALDSLGYEYYANTNQLKRVTDGVSATNYSDDIDNQTSTNYFYDAIGNLIHDEAEEIDTITWNVYGKITNIKRKVTSTKPDLAFQYTPDGHRVLKVVIPKLANSYKIYTYYVRDAQGNILATYERNFNKIIDYDSIKYKGINDTIIKVAGVSAFGGFISNTYQSTNNLADSLYKNAVDSNKAGIILTHLNLFDYVNADLEYNMNAIIDQYDANTLVNAVNNQLFHDNNILPFLIILCNSGVDITDFMLESHFDEYMMALYMSDPGQFESMFVSLSGNSWTDVNQAIDWIKTNSSVTVVRDWLNANWPGFTDCNTKMNIVLQIQPVPILQDFVREYFLNNYSSFVSQVKTFYTKTDLYNLLYNSDQSMLQSVILATFNNNTILQWYKTNQKNNFVQYAVTELRSRAAVWQQSKATHTMEQYFEKIKTYFGQVTYDNILVKYFNVSKAYRDSFSLSEWHVYGSSRIGIYANKTNLVNVKFYSDVNNGSFTNVDTTAYYYATQSFSLFTLKRGCKNYELSNHLGNVLVVVSDKKIQVCSTSIVTSYTADVVSANDYSAFGAPLAGRSYTEPNSDYRFGFTGLEKDNEIKGDGNSYNTEFRIYDSRIGVWLSTDPLFCKYPSHTPYNYTEGNPLVFTDRTGKGKNSTILDKNGNVVGGKLDGDKGVYKVDGVTVDNFDESKIEEYKKSGTKIGETLSERSFLTPEGQWRGHVNFNMLAFSKIYLATKTLGNYILSNSSGSFEHYKKNAGNGGIYDIKSWGFEQSTGKKWDEATAEERLSYVYEASFYNGSIIMTRRDQGNFFAGRAMAMTGTSESIWLSGFGAYQSNNNKTGFLFVLKAGINFLDQQILGYAINGFSSSGPRPIFADDKVSEDLQRVGFNQFVK